MDYRNQGIVGTIFEVKDVGNIFTRDVWLVLSLILAIALTAIGLIYTRHLSRHYVAEIQVTEQKLFDLQIEHSQLLLEQSTWGAPTRIFNIANVELKMVMPSEANTIFVKLS